MVSSLSFAFVVVVVVVFPCQLGGRAHFRISKTTVDTTSMSAADEERKHEEIDLDDLLDGTVVASIVCVCSLILLTLFFFFFLRRVCGMHVFDWQMRWMISVTK